MKIGDDVKVGDLKAPEGVEIMEDKGKVVCAVVSHKIEEAPKPEEVAAAATAEAAQPELIKKERAGEEEGEEGAAPAKGGAAPAKGAAPSERGGSGKGRKERQKEVKELSYICRGPGKPGPLSFITGFQPGHRIFSEAQSAKLVCGLPVFCMTIIGFADPV